MACSRGFTLISTVLILLAVAFLVTTTVTLLSVSDAQTSYAISQGASALGLVEGCAEDVLLLARKNASYAGGTLMRPEGSCSVGIAKNGNQWTATVRSTGEYVRAAQLVFNRTSAKVTLVSWHLIP